MSITLTDITNIKHQSTTVLTCRQDTSSCHKSITVNNPSHEKVAGRVARTWMLGHPDSASGLGRAETSSLEPCFSFERTCDKDKMPCSQSDRILCNGLSAARAGLATKLTISCRPRLAKVLTTKAANSRLQVVSSSTLRNLLWVRGTSSVLGVNTTGPSRASELVL